MDQQRAQGYAKAHQQFLEQNNPAVLAKQPDPQAYLNQVGRDAAQMHQQLSDQMQSEINSRFKDQPERMQAKLQELEAIPVTADEMIMDQLIRQPLPKM